MIVGIDTMNMNVPKTSETVNVCELSIVPMRIR
jgi:hypothetical protein